MLLENLAKYKISPKTSPKGTPKNIKVLREMIEVDNQDLNDFEGDVRYKKMKAQGHRIELSSRETRSNRLKSNKRKKYKEERKLFQLVKFLVGFYEINHKFEVI